MAVPGVQEAVAFNRAMAERGRDEGWHQIPEVLAAAVTHKLMTTPVWTIDRI